MTTVKTAFQRVSVSIAIAMWALQRSRPPSPRARLPQA